MLSAGSAWGVMLDCQGALGESRGGGLTFAGRLVLLCHREHQETTE